MPLIAETTFWGVIGWIFWVFLLALWFYLLIVIFMDLFSRHDLSGWAKAAWTIGIIIFPLVGILIYLITRPKPTPEEVAEAQAAEARAAGVTAADQLTQISALHDQGKLSDEEYAAEKKKIIGS